MEECKMKDWKKGSIIAGIALIIGIGSSEIYEEFFEDTKGYRNYVSRVTSESQATASTVTPDQSPHFMELDGKVTALKADSMTVDVPLHGSMTLRIDPNTQIEDFLLPLKKGSIVEIDANGDLAYKIETDRVMEAYGTIVSVNEQKVTISLNGKEETFKKASNFKIESDGYMGAIEGLPAEVHINENFEVSGLEVEHDYEDLYDD
jgi:hypothetical protein